MQYHMLCFLFLKGLFFKTVAKLHMCPLNRLVTTRSAQAVRLQRASSLNKELDLIQRRGVGV